MNAKHVAHQLRAEVAKRHQRMRWHQRFGYTFIALHVIISAWIASRVALGDADDAWLIVLNGSLALLGLAWWPRRWAEWMNIRADMEREIARLESLQ
jgi:hypothetical protein